MNILVNGNPHPLNNLDTLSCLVAQLGLSGQRIAVEVNGDIVPRAEYVEFRLGDGDRVEIIHAVGGG